MRQTDETVAQTGMPMVSGAKSGWIWVMLDLRPMRLRKKSRRDDS